MRLIYRSSLPAALVVLAVLAAPVRSAGQPAPNATAAAVAEFNKRVAAYMALHKQAEAAAPDVRKGATPAEVLEFENALAARIKAVRATAKQGDLFIPEVVPHFKKVFNEYYQRRSGREIRLLFDEVPNFKPLVNMTYPVDAPKATFPPRLALELPQLPEELEYRLVGTSLVLRDSEANLIVDDIPNIVPPPSAKK